MSNVIYNEYKNNLVTGQVAFINATTDFGVLLVDSSYTPTETDTFASLSANEVNTSAFPDYSRQELSSILVTTVNPGVTDTDDYIKVDAADTTFGSNVTVTAAGAVIFKKDTNLTNDPLSILSYTDFSGDKSSSNGEFTIVWNANGIFNYKQGA